MDKYIDKPIYDKAKDIVDKQYKKHSAYKSMQLIRTYKELGGRINEKLSKGGTSTWRSEKWKNLSPVALDLTSIKKAPVCGVKHPKQGKNKSICRPTVKVNSKTPKLAQSFSKTQIRRAQQLKNKGKRIEWTDL